MSRAPPGHREASMDPAGLWGLGSGRWTTPPALWAPLPSPGRTALARLQVGRKCIWPPPCIGCFWRELCDSVENIPTLKVCSFTYLSLTLSSWFRLGLSHRWSLRRWSTYSLSAHVCEFFLARNEPWVIPPCVMSCVWPNLTFSCRHSCAVWKETPYFSMCLRGGPSSNLWLCEIFCGLFLEPVPTDE